MANPEHLGILQHGVASWNEWRLANPAVLPDLSGADLFHSDLEGVNFADTNLSNCELGVCTLDGADLQRAKLLGVNCGLASLEHAILRGADLTHAVFSEAFLKFARLDSCELCGTHFEWTDLQGADFTNASMLFCTFGEIDFRSVIGLETIRHRARSSIGVDSIYASKGEIPISFMQGCGLPEEFIDFVRDRASVPIPYYSCFISYSTSDDEFAKRLYADLQDRGVRCWFAPHDLQGGKRVHEQIGDAISRNDRLLLILSENSMNSEWVKTEIAYARKREQDEGGRVLFPIRLVPFSTIRDWKCFDADRRKDSAREIREYFIPDFSDWKEHESYSSAFSRLLRDLRAGDSGNTPEESGSSTID